MLVLTLWLKGSGARRGDNRMVVRPPDAPEVVVTAASADASRGIAVVRVNGRPVALEVGGWVPLDGVTGCRISLVRATGRNARLAFDAPRSVVILRGSIADSTGADSVRTTTTSDRSAGR